MFCFVDVVRVFVIVFVVVCCLDFWVVLVFGWGLWDFSMRGHWGG